MSMTGNTHGKDVFDIRGRSLTVDVKTLLDSKNPTLRTLYLLRKIVLTYTEVMQGFFSISSTWTPKVFKIIAFLAFIMGLGLVSYKAFWYLVYLM